MADDNSHGNGSHEPTDRIDSEHPSGTSSRSVFRRTFLQSAAVGTTIGSIPSVAASADGDGSKSKGDDWIQLFDGDSLDGWTPKFTGYEAGENYKDTFVVENDLLKVKYDQYDDDWQDVWGHLFYDQIFSHYMLHVEYRFVGEQVPDAPEWAYKNNGLMLHGETAEEMELEQEYPNSLEFQLVGPLPDGSDRPNGDLCTPGTQAVDIDGELRTDHCWEDSAADTYEGDQWVSVVAVVRGNELTQHIVEGDVSLCYQEPQLENGTPVDDGTISIQAESHPTDFRKIAIREIDPELPISRDVPEEALKVF